MKNTVKVVGWKGHWYITNNGANVYDASGVKHWYGTKAVAEFYAKKYKESIASKSKGSDTTL